MNLLVDTHAMLWFVAGDRRLSDKVHAAISSPQNTSYISMASWWEIAIKNRLQRLALSKPLDVFMRDRADEGFRLLSIEASHLLPLVDLPLHHRDPFDRLLICQAIQEEMAVCTRDGVFKRYGVQTIW